MNAKKCDRCGILYEGDGGYKKAGDLILKMSGEYHDINIDLCPYCATVLNRWFRYAGELFDDKEGTKK